jgi:hypothetical protein
MTEKKPEILKIGYIPHSIDLQHPADRRRLAAWADSNEIKLNVENPLESDVLVLSNAANFGRWLSKATQPVILDLVDGYMGEHPSFLKDFARNSLRSLQGTSNLKWVTYTRHLRAACQRSDAIIVASPEQREAILKYNSNVHVILDDHSELATHNPLEGTNTPKELTSGNTKYLFWEGFGYTLKHFQLIARDLDRFLTREDWKMYLVTVRVFPKWGGFLGKIDSQTLIKKLFPISWERIIIIPWTLENLKKYSAISNCAIIPIDKSDKFGSLKSENKLLSMWQLGLPVLFSNIPSYLRVANASNQLSFCIDDEDWAAAFDSLINSRQQLASGDEERRTYMRQFHTHEILMKKWSDVIIGLVQKAALKPDSHVDVTGKPANRKSTL